jgi:hypothetical protein
MIPARPGTTADIEGDLVAVEAWDDEGRPLVVDTEERRLVPAEDKPGFLDVFHADLISIIPGGGWLALSEPDSASPEGFGYAMPVVAWGLKANGFIVPYIWRGDDAVVEAEQQDYTLWHPDQRPRPTG